MVTEPGRVVHVPHTPAPAQHPTLPKPGILPWALPAHQPHANGEQGWMVRVVRMKADTNMHHITQMEFKRVDLQLH